MNLKIFNHYRDLEHRPNMCAQLLKGSHHKQNVIPVSCCFQQTFAVGPTVEFPLWKRHFKTLIGPGSDDTGGKENLLLAPVSIRKKTGKNLSRNCSNDESNDARNPVINHAEESYPGVSLYDRADKAQSCEYRVRYVHFTIPILVHDVYIRYTEFVISIEDNFT